MNQHLKKPNRKLLLGFVLLVAGCAPAPTQGGDESATTGSEQPSGGVGGTESATGGSSSSGGAWSGGSSSSGGASIEVPDTGSEEAAGGSVGMVIPWPSDAVRSTIASFCFLDCESLESAQECSDGDRDGVPGHGEGCVDECKYHYYKVPLACETDLDGYFQCLMKNRGYFEAHCEGDVVVRQDTTSCADLLVTTQACIDEN